MSITKNDIKFNKKFGQNFIFDKNLLEAIISDSKIGNDDDVLEIGPGAGTLTSVIASRARQVVSYEIDENLRPVLEENLKSAKNSKIIFKDALKSPIEEIESNFEGEYTLVANLPYYITTPLIFKFLKRERLKAMCIMVQKEVGERLVANEHSGDYGSISVLISFYGNAKILRQVPRRMFVPSPNVDSCVVKIELERGKYNVDAELFEKIVKSAFSNRRKTLVNNISNDFNLSKTQVAEILKSLNISETARGDSLCVQQFVKICQELKKQFSK